MRKMIWRKATKSINSCYGEGAGETVRDMWIHDHPVWTGWPLAVAAGLLAGVALIGYVLCEKLNVGIAAGAAAGVGWLAYRWVSVINDDVDIKLRYQEQFPGLLVSEDWFGDVRETIPEVARRRAILQAKAENEDKPPKKQARRIYRGSDANEAQNAYLMAAINQMWDTHPQDFLCGAWLAYPEVLEACLIDQAGPQIGQVAVSIAETLDVKDTRRKKMRLGDLIETAQMVVA